MPNALYQRIQRKAAQESKPAAQVVRELLEDGLLRQQQETAGAALLRVAATSDSGPADLSQRINAYLYGNDHP